MESSHQPSLQREPETRFPPGVTFFLVAAFATSWGAWAIRAAFDWSDPVADALRIIIKFGPSLAGVLSALVFGGRGGLRSLLGRLFSLRFHPGWILFALFFPVLMLVVALPVRALFGGNVLSPTDLGFDGVALMFLELLGIRFIAGGGLGEELGWRGFMLPRLQGRMGAYQASIVIGLFHGAWHLPAYGVGALFLTVFTVAASIIFTWMANRTNGNLFLPALMHASGNASLPTFEALFPAIDNELGFPLILFGLWAVVAWVVVKVVGKNLGSRELDAR